MGVCVCRGEMDAVFGLANLPAHQNSRDRRAIRGSMISAKFARDPRKQPRYFQKSESAGLV